MGSRVLASRYGIRQCAGGCSSTHAGAGAGLQGRRAAAERAVGRLRHSGERRGLASILRVLILNTDPARSTARVLPRPTAAAHWRPRTATPPLLFVLSARAADLTRHMRCFNFAGQEFQLDETPGDFKPPDAAKSKVRSSTLLVPLSTLLVPV